MYNYTQPYLFSSQIQTTTTKKQRPAVCAPLLCLNASQKPCTEATQGKKKNGANYVQYQQQVEW